MSWVEKTLIKLPEKWRRLRGDEKKLCFRAVYLMAYFRLALFGRSFQSLYESVCIKRERAHRDTAESIPLQRLLRIIRYARRAVPFTTCLSEAYAAHTLLTENGFRPVLRIGVKKDPGAELEAHAWLTLDDRIVVGHLVDIHLYRQILPRDSQAG